MDLIRYKSLPHISPHGLLKYTIFQLLFLKNYNFLIIVSSFLINILSKKKSHLFKN